MNNVNNVRRLIKETPCWLCSKVRGMTKYMHSMMEDMDFFCFACQFWIAFLFSYFEIRRKFWLLYHRSTTTTTTTPTITTTTATMPTMTTTSTTSTTRTTAATTSSYVSRCYFFLFVFFLIFPDSVEPAIGVTKSDDTMIHQLEDVAENVPSSQNKPLLFLWLDVFF